MPPSAKDPTYALRRRTLTFLVALSLLTWTDSFGTVAQAAGTDATFVDFAQCANNAPPSVATNCPGGWINGTLNGSNSHYREDDVVPQRLEAALPVGGLTVARTLTITYLARKSGVHAYDSLATWNFTQTTADRCQGLAAADCVGGSPMTFPIPADPTVVADNGGPGSPTAAHQLAGQVMTMFGGTITSISVPSHDNAASPSMDDTATVVVTYSVPSLPAKVQLLFGGHLAASIGPRGWGPNLGAASISGSAYHIKWTMADTSSIGNRDNQIQASALTAQPTISTTPNPSSGSVGTALNDSAAIANGNQPSGSITFRLFGAGDTSCSGTPVFTQTVTVNGNGTYSTTGGFVATSPGTYQWTASYSGDFANKTAVSSCGSEPVTITKASPTISTTPNPSSGTVGTTLNDSAALSGGASPTGTIVFRLFAPADATCAATPVFTQTVAVNGNGTYSTSGGFVATSPGTYRWTATYSGDANNNGAASGCDAEQVSIAKASPTITTTASTTIAVGGSISDTAHLSGGVTPTGTITFTLFGPNDATCATPQGTSSKTVSGNGDYTSDPFVVTAAGTYRFIAAYSGDANNNAATTACNDAGESVDVSKASPSITTTPSPSSGTVGDTLNDSATLSGGAGPTGTIVFRLFAPADPTCGAAPLFTQTVTVSGNGTYSTTGGYPTTAPGTYRWTATYSGDANNNGAASGCDAEQVVIAKGHPSLTTTASGPVSAGGQLTDTAHLTGGVSPTGAITFNLYRDASCSLSVFASTKTVSGNGDYTSDGYTALIAGTYHWTATYSGDANNDAAGPTACNDPNEQTVVAKAQPTITTTASGTVAAGGSVTDTAHLAGGAAPSGTITFTIYGPDDATCAAPTGTNSRTVSGNGDYTSDPFPVVAAGTYRFIASYSGDANNETATTACNDANESVVVTKASPTLTTTASGSVAAGGMISDTAHLAGGSAPTGRIDFALYDDAGCTSIVFLDSVTVSGNGDYHSHAYTALVAGTYHWVAQYSGDANNNGAGPTACADPNESVTVTKASPTITTTASQTVAAGGTVSDTAHLAGGAAPGGTITFTLYGPNDSTCATPTDSRVVAVNGNGDYSSGPFVVNAAGTYRFIASYSGDANNNATATACNDANESVEVSKASPTLTTTASGSVAAGGTISDTAHLAGGTNPTGTITFTLYGPNDATCAIPQGTSSATVSGNGDYSSGSFTVLLAGTYRFTASYSGDANNNGTSTACNDANESVEVTKATPTLTTTASPSVAAGGSVSDTAHLGSGVNPIGTITFVLYGDAGCTASVFTGTTPVNGNGDYGSGSTVVLQAGTYHWVATYSGDANNNGVTTACDDPAEQVVVTKATPAITTNASGSVAAGGTVTDTAHLTGGTAPTGTITFTIYGPNDATCATPTGTSVKTVTGNGDYTSDPFPVAAAGTYRFIASYSGDANNESATTACNDANESVVVTKASPVLSTTASPGVTAGGSVSDTAHLSGGSAPTGTITFTLYSDASCTVSVFTDTKTVSGNGDYTSASYTAMVAGTYHWVASYSGDASNNAAGPTPCADPNEQVIVSRAQPTLTTTASSGTSAGGTVTDTAHLGGGAAPTGTITFTIYGPDDATCAIAKGTSVRSVSGNGDYTSGPFAVAAAGTYRFTASYSGDTNNNAASTACNDPNESVAVTKASPTVTTNASGSTAVGGSVTDTAHLVGGSAPSGTITFTLYSDASCTVSVFTTTKTVNGNGDYTSDPYTTVAPGTYQWIASYSGDANNNGATTHCGDANESVVVTKASPSITTTPNPSSATTGQTLNDTATLSGGVSPTGTITFNLYGPTDPSCGAAPVFTQTVTVSGNGTYSTTGGYVATVAGTYHWSATYSGDANNNSASSPCSAEPVTVSSPHVFGFMTGGGEVTGTGGALVTYGGNASGTTNGTDAKGHFNILNHSTKEHFEGDVTQILDVNPTTHEMTFCFTTKSGSQYTVTWRDNGEPGNTSAGTSAANADKLTLRTGCSLTGPILWGVVNDPVLHGNIQWHDQGR